LIFNKFTVRTKRIDSVLSTLLDLRRIIRKVIYFYEFQGIPDLRKQVLDCNLNEILYKRYSQNKGILKMHTEHFSVSFLTL